MTRREIEGLLTAKLREVLGVAESAVAADARFDEDLHADSLDLVEVVEAVEARMRARGVPARLPEERLLALRTVGDAVEALHGLCEPGIRG